MAQALPYTLLLASVGLFLELTLGLALALVQARHPHGFCDRALTALSLAAYALPTFLVAAGLLWLFTYAWPLLPPSHATSLFMPEESLWPHLWDRLAHLALPAATVALTGCGAVARYLRGALLEEQGHAYILAARARGASQRRALLLHALPNACLPLITLVGLSLPFLVSGSLVIEVIFSWPGMGQLFYMAVTARDLPLVQGITVLVTSAVVAGNWLADVTYTLVDPRIRL
jgi:peptide/nickel transport system permease protein